MKNKKLVHMLVSVIVLLAACIAVEYFFAEAKLAKEAAAEEKRAEQRVTDEASVADRPRLEKEARLEDIRQEYYTEFAKHGPMIYPRAAEPMINVGCSLGELQQKYLDIKNRYLDVKGSGEDFFTKAVELEVGHLSKSMSLEKPCLSMIK